MDSPKSTQSDDQSCSSAHSVEDCFCQILCIITGQQIHTFLFWVYNAQPMWCQLELRSCVSSSLPALLFSSPSRYTDNQIVFYFLKIWYQFRHNFKSYTISTLMPITRNHLFAPSFLDSAFRLWERNGIQTFTDLYIGRVFGSFTDLSASHNLPTTHLLRYFQIS